MNYLDIIKKVKERVRDPVENEDHSSCESLYGHLSNVTDITNFVKYPNLKNTHPLTFTLNKGEALIIPKNWWHYVVSYEDMYGCNFWTSKKLGDYPTKINHNIKIDYESLKDENIFIWQSGSESNENRTKEIKFKDYIVSKNDNEYFWTLKNYEILSKNSHIINKIKNNIEIPEIIQQTKTNFELNIMACSKNHATPLHYDDEDGLLCVTHGRKEVTLFPPEDSINLYPIQFEKYKWRHSPAINCCYNLYRKSNQINGSSSANLLYQTCSDNKGVMSSISKIIKQFHGSDNVNKTVWGFKNINKNYEWELYNYEDKNATIKSFEIYPERKSTGEYVSSFYDEYILTKNVGDYYEGTIFRNELKRVIRGYWILDTQNNFITNLNKYTELLKFPKDIFTEDIIKKYQCSYVCLHQKNNQEAYIQYIYISKNDFIHFLKVNNYEASLIEHYECSDYQISNEITIVYDINTMEVKRTAFYGIV